MQLIEHSLNYEKCISEIEGFFYTISYDFELKNLREKEYIEKKNVSK